MICSRSHAYVKFNPRRSDCISSFKLFRCKNFFSNEWSPKAGGRPQDKSWPEHTQHFASRIFACRQFSFGRWRCVWSTHALSPHLLISVLYLDQFRPSLFSAARFVAWVDGGGHLTPLVLTTFRAQFALNGALGHAARTIKLSRLVWIVLYACGSKFSTSSSFLIGFFFFLPNCVCVRVCVHRLADSAMAFCTFSQSTFDLLCASGLGQQTWPMLGVIGVLFRCWHLCNSISQQHSTAKDYLFIRIIVKPALFLLFLLFRSSSSGALELLPDHQQPPYISLTLDSPVALVFRITIGIMFEHLFMSTAWLSVPACAIHYHHHNHDRYSG